MISTYSDVGIGFAPCAFYAPNTSSPQRRFDAIMHGQSDLYRTAASGAACLSVLMAVAQQTVTHKKMFISDPTRDPVTDSAGVTNTGNDVQHITQPQRQPRQLSNALLRAMTGMVLIPLVLLGAFLGGWLWLLIVSLMGLLCLLEFYGLAFAALRQRRERGGWGVSRTALFGGVACLLGLIYIVVPMAMLVILRAQPGGFLWIMTIFGITAGTDTLAYVGGGLFGHTRFAPALSPNKTVEGAGFGIAGAAVIVILFVSARSQLNAATLVIAVLGPVVAVLGDLLESALKRAYQVKDSHLGRLTVVPGHGGVLDRGDSLLLVTPFVFITLLLTGIVVF